MSHRSRRKSRGLGVAPGPRESPGGGRPAVPRAWGPPDWLVGLLLMAATLLVYERVWHAGFVWDDDDHIAISLADYTWSKFSPISVKGIPTE